MIRAGATALVIGVAAVGFAPAASAYVRYTIQPSTDAGTAAPVKFFWSQSCVAITDYPTNFEGVMPADEIQSAIDGATSAWSSRGDACTYLNVYATTSTMAPPRAINDHHNAMIFRTSSWCELLSDGTCAVAIGAYDQAALAVTSVVASKSTGEIRDADIEINGFHHQWADLVAHPDVLATEPQTQDLQNALTHEMGHLIGLDHTCWPGPTSGVPDPVDNLGNPVPECNAASADVQATTMFPSAVNGDIQKRTLAPDDQLAVCEIYPAASDPMVCAPDAPAGGCGCSLARSSAASAQETGLVVLASLLSLLLLGMRRRRGARGARAARASRGARG